MEDTLGASISIRMSAYRYVLILVLMEDTLGECCGLPGLSRIPRVLILVLMEDTLGEDNYVSVSLSLDKVLILVLMEDTLGVSEQIM